MNWRDQARKYFPRPILQVKRSVQRQFDLRRSLARLRLLEPSSTAINAYRFAMAFQGLGNFSSIRPSQDEFEICGLVEFLSANRVRSACEIGSFFGGTLFMLARALPEHSRIFSIDWPEASDSPEWVRSRKDFYQGFAGPTQKLSVILGNSRAPETMSRLASELDGDLLDFLFIDADHSFEAVSTDFANYSRFVKPGGLIGFHDIVPHDTEGFGVADFWAQLASQYRHVEFVSPENRARRQGLGIGVLWWDGKNAMAG